ncbi:MAG: HlyD family type I secretion periplasmic adaptor subunit [Ferrovibrio sp.]|uniref:HlyD family type I secretion periplasmic adaptor subunit n=1 Tax=Ferrovibrio sp. TaxID=1917215 RepID=UPI002601A9D4|nr:HlyD family type I secretion periplasmic adaptor subunit [Ferrovibrio sp.]MCW0234069.1 HlyD family type I secretion periplasmic adaptor subunit [Ferrovibrio sp.]
MSSNSGGQSIWGGLRNAAEIAYAAWKREKQRGPQQPRQRNEVEFLPAALEILETPASPTARYTFWAMTALLAVSLAWSFVGELDIVAIAEGRTIPAGQSKLIQPLEPGVVRAIHVQNGQHVGAGENLVELDSTAAGADMRRLTSELVAARLDAARLEAAAMPTEALRRFVPPIGTPKYLADLHTAMLASQVDEHLARLAGLDAELDRRKAERKSVEADIARLENALPLLRTRSDARTELAQKGFGSRLLALELQQQQVEMEYTLRGQRHRREEASAALEALQRQRRQIQSEYLKIVLSQRDEAQRKAGALEEEFLKAEQRHGLQTLTAPLDGMVQQLVIHTIGGVVTPAQVLMVIVPDNAPLEVEATVQNRDIGFIQPGQDVEVKVETFLFTKYGTIPGKVISVSRDAVQDEKRGLIYPIRVALERSSINVEGRQIELGAGMALTAEVKTDRRRVIDYLLSPIARYRQESLRER